MKAAVSDEVFNVASQRETSLRQLCEALLATMGSPLVPTHVPLPEERKAVEVGRRLADTEKARKLLGFEARVDLERGLSRLVRWLDEYADTIR
jgi:UDP-glucose 4-epimerase